MNGLAGKTVLVTGASNGIGFATVRRLASTGARVVAHYNSNAEGARDATAGFREGQAVHVGADLSTSDGAGTLWNEAVAAVGRIDAVVLNAGIMPKVELDAADAEWDETMQQALQVNTLSQLSLIRRSVSHFQEHGGGTIVGLTSWVTQRGAGNPNLTAYAASKAATAAALKTVARAYAKDGVLVYMIAPGAVDTQMTAASAADRGGREAILQSLTMGEMVPPEEIAELVAALAPGKIRHLSGATLDINGASYVR